jgi:hypothetical protein
VKSAIAQLQANNPVTALSAISLRQLAERFLEGRSGLFRRGSSMEEQQGLREKIVEWFAPIILKNMAVMTIKEITPGCQRPA